MSSTIVLGLGGTVDYELHWDAEVFQRLITDYNVESVDLGTSDVLVSERDVIVAIAGFMRSGKGGERFVKDPLVLVDFSNRFAFDTTLGGTCVRGAIALSRLGVGSIVHLVSISDEVRALLPSTVEYISSAPGDSLDPHVIVQFPGAQNVTLTDGISFSTTKANRVILVNDPPNEKLLLSDELGERLKGASAFLVSGFNTIKSEEVLLERLTTLEPWILGMPEGAIVVYEDAGFHDVRFRQTVLSRVPNFADVYSMNEDEAQELLGRIVDWGSGADVALAIVQLHQEIGVENLVVHTAHFAAVCGPKSELLSHAVLEGAALASTRFGFGDAFDRNDYYYVLAGDRDDVGVRLKESAPIQKSGVTIVPGFDVKTATPTTIGLGDAFIGGVMGYLGRRA